jgi:thiol-disulfide isomerase/thioredoxin
MPLRTGSPLPELSGATEWRNGDVSRESLLGSPVLIHFWSLSCYICKGNLPRLKEWKEIYGPQGLKVIAVHMPREENETELAKVEAALEQFSITEPCAIDNEHKLTEAFGNDQAWVPYYFLFDADGNLKSRGAGQAAADVLAGALARLFPDN